MIKGILFSIFGAVLGLCAIEDCRNLSIRIRKIYLLLGAGALLVAVQWEMIPVWQRGLGILPGAILCYFGKRTGSVGIADGITCAIIGGCMGIQQGMEICSLALLLIGLLALIYLASGKKKGKDVLPFLPFLFAGYIPVWINGIVG